MYWMNDPDPYCSVGSPYVNYKGSSNNSVYISSGDVIVLRDGNNNPLHSVIATSSGSSPTSVNTIAKMGCYGVFTGTLQQMIATYSGTVKYDVYET